MDIEDIPNLREERWPRKVTFAIDEETWRKLQLLKSRHGKSHSALGRALLEEFFKEHEELFKEGLPSGT